MQNRSPLREAFDLSAEILADMELARIPNHQILLKCRRLARLVGDEAWWKWLDLELHGYNVDLAGVSQEERVAYFTLFARELDNKKHTGLVHPLATLEQEVETAKLEMQACKVPASIHAGTLAPDSALGVVNRILLRLQDLNTIITQRQVIISRVMGSAYSYALRWYNELHYSDIAQSIFERRRAEVDRKLKDLCPVALEQFVSAYERLRSGSKEDWSQALLSCRRILKSFAESVFPSRDEPYIDKEGKKRDVSEEKYINRLIAFLEQRSASSTFRELVRAQVESLGIRLGGIYDEAHKGVHADVTRQEADSTVLLTYLLLSDMVDLLPIPDKPGPEINKSPLSAE